MYEDIIKKANEYLKSFDFDNYHKILGEYQRKKDLEVKDYANILYLDSKGYDLEFKYEKAIDRMKTVVVFVENNSDYFNFYGNMLDNTDKYDIAIDCYQKALEILEKTTIEENNSKFAIYYNNIGLAYDSKGEYDKAIEFYNRAIDIDKIIGKINSETANHYYNISCAYYYKNDYINAKLNFEKALDIANKFKYFNKNRLDNIKYGLELVNNELNKTK